MCIITIKSILNRIGLRNTYTDFIPSPTAISMMMVHIIRIRCNCIKTS